MKLLAEGDHCSPDIRRELTRTPSIRARMTEVGFLPPATDGPHDRDRYRPPRYREVVSKFGPEPPRQRIPDRPIPRSVRIGKRRRKARQLMLIERDCSSEFGQRRPRPWPRSGAYPTARLGRPVDVSQFRSRREVSEPKRQRVIGCADRDYRVSGPRNQRRSPSGSRSDIGAYWLWCPALNL